jgi:hypothetical protein
MAGGRPTEYSPDMLDRSRNYLVAAQDEVIAKDIIHVNLPSVAGLALFLGVARNTIYEWAKTNAEFQDILEQILATQEKRLIERSLGDQYNSTIAKLMLTKHGYSDKQEIDHQGALSVNVISFKDNNPPA